ncbi:MAG: hypothetical protein IJ213_02730 [Bacteroidales bacterium]|nr:hypothetical protein [Bacteroidales bacterium]
MKKVLLVLFSAVLLLSNANLQAQNKKEVTKFLGIAVDGTKTVFEQKLKNKGFVYNASTKSYKGQFNGRDVNVHVVTNNNKVYRVMVADAVSSSETDIKIRFNKLCQQFLNNGKYVPMNLTGDYMIDDDEDISYNIMVNKKRYEAAFYQCTDEDLKFFQDTVAMQEQAMQMVLSRYSEEELENPTEEMQRDFFNMGIELALSRMRHRKVWFMISDDIISGYKILMYYDNELNQSNGEDL